MTKHGLPLTVKTTGCLASATMATISRWFLKNSVIENTRRKSNMVPPKRIKHLYATLPCICLRRPIERRLAATKNPTRLGHWHIAVTPKSLRKLKFLAGEQSSTTT
jgi:hypothetical protein